MSKLFENLFRLEYSIDEAGIKIPYSDFDRPESYYDNVKSKTYTGKEFAEMMQFKDRTISLYDKRWQSARAVIDLVAAELGIDPEKCGLHLYGVVQAKGKFESPLVEQIRTWANGSGDKVKLKKQIKDLEAQVAALRQALRE